MNWRKSPRSNPTWGWKLITNIYDTVHIALWSILIAAIIFFSCLRCQKFGRYRRSWRCSEFKRSQQKIYATAKNGASRWERTSIWRVRLICRNFAQKSSSAPLTTCSGSGMDCR
jgi:hypothetical protein